MGKKPGRKSCQKPSQILSDTDHKPVIEYTVTPDLPPCASINSTAKIDCGQSSEAIETVKQASGQGDAQKRPETLDQRPSLPNIPIKQRLFIKALTDPSSPTYGNQTRSYQRAYGDVSDDVAAVNGSRVMTSAKVKTWIDDILDKIDAGVQVRAGRVNIIASGRAEPITIKREVLNKDGQIVTLKETRPPTFSERIKADALLSKIAGDTNESKHTNKLAQIEYKELCKRAFKQASNKVRKVKEMQDVEPIEGDTGSTGGRD